MPAAILRPVIEVYRRAYNVDLHEAVVPPEGFRSFNDFFTRRLRDGVRVFDQDPHTILSPADGRLEDHGPLDRASTFSIKGQRYDAETLLGSRAEAEHYKGGQYAIVYLSPRDYHRVHSPIEGRVTRVRHIPGTLYPVNALGVAHVPQLFARNERVVVNVETEAFGTVAVVFVGAFIVGKISLAFDAPARPPHGGAVTERTYAPASAPKVTRGGELGAFSRLDRRDASPHRPRGIGRSWALTTRRRCAWVSPWPAGARRKTPHAERQLGLPWGLHPSRAHPGGARRPGDPRGRRPRPRAQAPLAAPDADPGRRGAARRRGDLSLARRPLIDDPTTVVPTLAELAAAAPVEAPEAHVSMRVVRRSHRKVGGPESDIPAMPLPVPEPVARAQPDARSVRASAGVDFHLRRSRFDLSAAAVTAG